MSQLIVRNLEPQIVDALRARAAAHGRSAEAEHRAILREVLLPEAAGEAFKQWLLQMPPGVEDQDFDFARDRARPVEL